MKPPLRGTASPDDFQTPPGAVIPLLPYLKKEWVVWEPACGEGYLVDFMKTQGFNVLATDIKSGHDYLAWEPPEYDFMITNPP